MQEWFKCFYTFVTRFLCCFLLDYWLSLEAISFFLTLLIVGFNLVDKLVPSDMASTVDMFHKLCYENPLFKAWVDVNLKEISAPSTPPPGTLGVKRTWQQWFSYFFAEVCCFFYICGYIAITAGSAKAKGSILTAPLVLENVFH